MVTKRAFVHILSLLADHKALPVLNDIILSFEIQQSECWNDCAGAVPQKSHSWKTSTSTSEL